MTRRKATAANVDGGARPSRSDLAYIRFVRDIAEIQVQSGDVDERVLAALAQVRGALVPSTPELTRYLRLGEALDEATSTLVNASPADMLNYLKAKSQGLSQLIDNMHLAEAVPEGLGIQSMASLLSAPQRMIEVNDTVLMLGMFAALGEKQNARAVLIRSRYERQGHYKEVRFDSVDEAGKSAVDIERLLADVAYEGRIRPLKPRTRAAVLASRETLGAFGEIDPLQRRIEAIGTVHDTVVETHIVLDQRNLAPVDHALAGRGYHLLFVIAHPQEQWAFRRSDRVRGSGIDVQIIYPTTGEDVLAEISDVLRGLVDDPDEDHEAGAVSIEPGLSEEQQSGIRASIKAAGINIVFVGGNQTQEQYQARIEADLVELFGGGISIRWFEGWGSSWNTTADAVDRALPDSDALVLMNYMRTELGRTLRRTAGAHDVPWIKCTGSGKASIQSSIVRALDVVVRSRAR